MKSLKELNFQSKDETAWPFKNLRFESLLREHFVFCSHLWYWVCLCGSLCVYSFFSTHSIAPFLDHLQFVSKYRRYEKRHKNISSKLIWMSEDFLQKCNYSTAMVWLQLCGWLAVYLIHVLYKITLLFHSFEKNLISTIVRTWLLLPRIRSNFSWISRILQSKSL